MQLSKIDFGKIKQLKIRAFLQMQISNGSKRIADIRSTMPDDSDLKNYSSVTDTILSDLSPEILFDHYVNCDINTAWNCGESLQLGLVLDKKSGQHFYAGSDIQNAQEGFLMYVQMKYWNILTIANAQEVVEVNEIEKRLVFSYIEGSKSSGKQVVLFHNLENGGCKIEHISFFRSNSRIRDKYFYPYFHKKTILLYHKNMCAMLNGRS